MSNTITIPLSQRYEVHGGVFEALTLREPSADEFLRIGEIETWQPSGNRQAVQVLNDEAVFDYLKACVVSPAQGVSGIDALSELRLQDARKVRSRFIGFFEGRPTDATPS